MKEKPSILVAVAFAALFTLGLTGCAKAPTDSSIAESIKAGFYSDAQLKMENLSVAVNRGEVTLSGEVSGDSARLQAYKLAAAIPGVTKVNDQMTVRSAQTSQASPEASVAPQASEVPAERAKTSTKGVVQKPAEPRQVSPAQAAQPGTAQPAPQPSPAAADKTATGAGSPPPAPKAVNIPEGTMINIRMMDAVDSEKNRVGELFQAELDEPIRIHNEIVVPKGSQVSVKLIDAKKAGKLSGQSELQLSLDSLKFQGKSYRLVSNSYQQTGKSRGKDTTTKVAIGAAIGAAVGAIAGGGKGAAIGAGSGAGAGAVVQVLTKGPQVKIPSETLLDFRLETSVEVLVQPGEAQQPKSQ